MLKTLAGIFFLMAIVVVLRGAVAAFDPDEDR